MGREVTTFFTVLFCIAVVVLLFLILITITYYGVKAVAALHGVRIALEEWK